MKDYKSLWEKWFSLVNQNLPSRKRLLDALHMETQKGFDVITRIATEELMNRIKKEIFHKVKDNVEASIALCVLSGYSLFLVDARIDPLKENFVDNTAVSDLGNLWMKHYENDRETSLLGNIDPVLSMFLEKVAQNEINRLFVMQPLLIDLPYRQVGHVESFYNWASHQGFILGILERQLIHKNPE